MVVMAFIFIAVLLAGVPVFIALAGASFIYTHFIAGMPDFVILHRMAGGIDSFPLLAVPFFILAGNLMNSAGITNRIYDFAVALAGWTRGGLAHVNIIGSVIFAGMSGTAIADAAGLGTIEIKAMQDHGYDTEFSVGVTAASSTLGPIIPPSLPFVIYGMMGNVSIGALFLGGVIPGAVMTIFMMAYVYYCARRYGMGRDQAFRWKTLGLTFVAAFPALLTPAMEWCAPQPYRKSVAHRILSRLAMQDSVPGTDLQNKDLDLPEGLFDADDLDRYRTVLERLAVPYKVDGRGRAERIDLPPGGIDAAGGLVSTVRDLAKLDAALDPSLESGRILLPETLAMAWSPAAGRDGTQTPMGLGWFVQSYRGQRVVWQFGSVPNAYSSLVIKLPERGLTFILLANSDGLSAPFQLQAGDVTKSVFAALFLRLAI